ncbi:MAG: hypothetical protein ACRDRW_01350 [Pseudonocardiaceae bacterium]
MTDLPLPRWNGKCPRVIPATSVPRRGPVGVTTLVLNTRSGVIELDPQAVGACTITINKDAARRLRDALSEWFG